MPPPYSSAPWLTRPPEITACNANQDWDRLQEIRESIVTRAPVYLAPSLISQTQPTTPAQPRTQTPPQPLPQSQSAPSRRSQPLSQSQYYQGVRPETPPSYAMGQYGQSNYGALNGLRTQNPPALPYQAPTAAPSNRMRPNAGLVPPTITYKPSPFYELKYQIGDVKTLEGASTASPPPSSAPLICWWLTRSSDGGAP